MEPTAFGYVLAELAPSLQGVTVNASFTTQSSRACMLAGARDTCSVATCTDPDTLEGASAGSIFVAGASQPIMLAPKMGARGVHYDPFFAQTAIFASMSVLDAKWSGGEVPSAGGMVTIPSETTLLSPSVTSGSILDTSKSLALAWSATSAPEAIFYVSTNPSQDATKAFVLACIFTASTRSAVVPAAALQQLRALGGKASYSAAFLPAARAPVEVGAWHVELIGLGQGTLGSVELM
jgi:hypothetical protein